MKVIETEYKGYRFRSRLEARWAVFFDACNVKWEYEPEGFDLGDGLYYLPDFLLHDVLFRDYDTPRDLWVEVKGNMTETDAKKIIKFAGNREEIKDCCLDAYENPILVLTNIPAGNDFGEIRDNIIDETYNYTRPYPFNYELIDGDYFGAIPVINNQGLFVIADEIERVVGSIDKTATANAYRLARQARFDTKKNSRAYKDELLKSNFALIDPTIFKHCVAPCTYAEANGLKILDDIAEIGKNYLRLFYSHPTITVKDFFKTTLPKIENMDFGDGGYTYYELQEVRKNFYDMNDALEFSIEMVREDFISAINDFYKAVKEIKSDTRPRSEILKAEGWDSINSARSQHDYSEELS